MSLFLILEICHYYYFLFDGGLLNTDCCPCLSTQQTTEEENLYALFVAYRQLPNIKLSINWSINISGYQISHLNSPFIG